MSEMIQAFPFRFERARYSEHYLMSHLTEADVQRDIIQLLTAHKVDVAAVDVGGRRARGRIMAAAAAQGIDASAIGRVRLGGEIPAGFSDLEATLAPQGRSLYIEVKAPAWVDANGKIQAHAGKPTAEQLAFLSSKFQRGAIVLVAWSVTDVMSYCGGAIEANRRSIR